MDLKNFQDSVTKIVDSLKKDLQTVRTGRASSDLVAHILVDAYGVKTPIDQLASVMVPEPRLIVIQPWDRNVIKAIETALTQANLGMMPSAKESVIHLNLPPLNEETRKNLVKTLHQKLEHWREEVRAMRDEWRNKINRAAKEKELTEDDKFSLLQDLDKKSSQFITEIEEAGKKKEKEIITI
jgi:ribosome recycling factor